MAFRTDARRLTVGAPNGDLVLWDTTVPARPQPAGRLREGRGILAATWNPAAASLLATAASDGSITAWRLPGDRAPERIGRWAAPSPRPEHVGWAAGGRWVFSMTGGGDTCVWDVHSGSPVGRADLTGGRPVVAAHHRGDLIVVITADGWARLWDPLDRGPGGWIRLTAMPVGACAWSDTLLLVAGVDGRVACFDPDFRLVRSLRIDRERPRALACDRRSRVVALLAGGRAVAADLDGVVQWQCTLGPASVGPVTVAEGLVAVSNGVAGPILLDLADGHRA